MKMLQEVEDKIVATVHDLVAEAIEREPVIEAAVADALHEAGAPPQIAAALGELVKLLKEHFSGERAPEPVPAPEPAPEPQPDPGTPGA